MMGIKWNEKIQSIEVLRVKDLIMVMVEGNRKRRKEKTTTNRQTFKVNNGSRRGFLGSTPRFMICVTRMNPPLGV